MSSDIWLYPDQEEVEEMNWTTCTMKNAIPEPPRFMRNQDHLGSDCVFCKAVLELLGTKRDDGEVFLQVCPSCGWWIILSVMDQRGIPYGRFTFCRASAILKNLDMSDVSVPTVELTRYLLAKYGDRFHIHPKKYEEVVASVFSDFGYCVRVTGYSRDRGLDIAVLDGRSNDTIGIQVKRYRGKIEAEQIRSFAGALVLHGWTRGIFVTTSSYTKGAESTARDFRKIQLGVDLWDADKFYDRLRVSQRSPYTSPDDESAPYYDLWKDPGKIPRLYQETW